jgi:hypothetical protein
MSVENGLDETRVLKTEAVEAHKEFIKFQLLSTKSWIPLFPLNLFGCVIGCERPGPPQQFQVPVS